MENLEKQWQRLLDSISGSFKRQADLKGILFLIGIRESGRKKKKYTKEEKEKLMNEAVCRVLSRSGYFEPNGKDRKGLTRWKQSKPFPRLDTKSQEQMLKEHIVYYFQEEGLIE